MALAQPASKLPAAQAARREKMISLNQSNPAEEAARAAEAAQAEAAAAEASAQAAAEEAARAEAANDPRNQSVTLTQGELDQRLEESNREAEIARMEAEELRAQLTEATRARNEQPRQVAAPDLGFTEQDLVISPEEEAEFGGARSYVVKLVRSEVAAAIAKLNVALDTRLVGVEQAAGSVAQTLQKTNERRFKDRVIAEIPDVVQLAGHPKFKEFLRLPVPMTDIDYNEALNRAHAKENLKAVLDIFAAFRTKYAVAQSSTAGYAGARGSAAAAEPAPTTTGKRFTMKDRKAQSDKFIKGQISKEAFETFKIEFDQAMKDGRVDD